jgi:hypothetical protein
VEGAAGHGTGSEHDTKTAAPCANREPPETTRHTWIERRSFMSVPEGREPSHDIASWATVAREAIKSNRQTARLCVIWLVMRGGPVAGVGVALAELLKHLR